MSTAKAAAAAIAASAVAGAGPDLTIARRPPPRSFGLLVDATAAASREAKQPAKTWHDGRGWGTCAHERAPAPDVQLVMACRIRPINSVTLKALHSYTLAVGRCQQQRVRARRIVDGPALVERLEVLNDFGGDLLDLPLRHMAARRPIDILDRASLAGFRGKIWFPVQEVKTIRPASEVDPTLDPSAGSRPIRKRPRGISRSTLSSGIRTPRSVRAHGDVRGRGRGRRGHPVPSRRRGAGPERSTDRAAGLTRGPLIERGVADLPRVRPCRLPGHVAASRSSLRRRASARARSRHCR